MDRVSGPLAWFVPGPNVCGGRAARHFASGSELCWGNPLNADIPDKTDHVFNAEKADRTQRAGPSIRDFSNFRTG